MGSLLSQRRLSQWIFLWVIKFFSFVWKSCDKNALNISKTSTLEKQIVKLIDARLSSARSYRLLSGVSVLASLCVGALAFSIRPSLAQVVVADAQSPALEVLSVKQVKDSGGFSNIQITPDGLSVTNSQLWLLIRVAFGAEFFSDGQIFGEPSWSHSERYDIAGKVSDVDVGKLRNLNHDQERRMTQAMLQEVLVERFHMKFHQENRDAPIYVLVVAKGGPKLKETTPGDSYSKGLLGPAGSKVGAGFLNVGRDHISGQGLSLEELAKALSGANTGRVVIDKTGLRGKYDFTLNWSPDQGVPPPGLDGGAPASASGPSIFTAIQEQLGLRLEPTKGPVKTLVIEHIERPSAN